MPQNVPFELDHYKLRVVEPPTLKMKKEMENGKVVSERPATTPDGEALYEVVLYSRARQKNDFGEKDSEELKITLKTPCEDIEEDDIVELVQPTYSTYSFQSKNGKISGVSYRAEALVKAS